MSVIAKGKVRKIDDLAQERDVLQALLDKYTPGFFRTPLSDVTVDKYRAASSSSRVAVFVLEVETMSPTADDVDPARYFRPGDTIEHFRT